MPAMSTTVMQRQGIKGMYVPFKVQPEEIGKALQSLRILNIAGTNVTVPYKERVIPYLDILSEGANVIGRSTPSCARITLEPTHSQSGNLSLAQSHKHFTPYRPTTLMPLAPGHRCFELSNGYVYPVEETQFQCRVP